jgi:hypothetical protein
LTDDKKKRFPGICNLNAKNDIIASEVLAMRIELEQEQDGRWIAEAPDLPGVMTYRATRDEAIDKVQSMALRGLAERFTPLTKPF